MQKSCFSSDFQEILVLECFSDCLLAFRRFLKNGTVIFTIQKDSESSIQDLSIGI